MVAGGMVCDSSGTLQLLFKMPVMFMTTVLDSVMNDRQRRQILQWKKLPQWETCSDVEEKIIFLLTIIIDIDHCY